ncbi:alpha/beta hydrolase family protein [Bradyrhizobium sp. RDM12]
MKSNARSTLTSAFARATTAVLLLATQVSAQEIKIAKTDMQVDALDPGIKLFLREKMAEANTTFNEDNVILFLHGATSPSTCDFDLAYKDYSWADWLVKKGYVVYMGDYRNYGGSSREPAMDEAASKNPISRCATSKRWSTPSGLSAVSRRSP